MADDASASAPTVALVTDSTTCLPARLVERHRLTVVPLAVRLGEREGWEGEDVTPADVAAALRDKLTVQTSRPSPPAFSDAYRAAAERLEVRTVVAVTLSGRVSGTVDAARLGAQAVADEGLEVRVVDSRGLAMGTGFAVLAAARAAAAGAGVDDVVAAADAVELRTTTIFVVDTLEHLRRGGRIGAAAGLIGTALAVKPLLHVVDGQVALLEKVRTSGRALARLTDLAAEAAGSGPVDVAVHHLDAASRAEDAAAELRHRIPGLRSVHVSEVGAVVGAHVGPGLVGVVVSRRAPAA